MPLMVAWKVSTWTQLYAKVSDYSKWSFYIGRFRPTSCHPSRNSEDDLESVSVELITQSHAVATGPWATSRFHEVRP